MKGFQWLRSKPSFIKDNDRIEHFSTLLLIAVLFVIFSLLEAVAANLPANILEGQANNRTNISTPPPEGKGTPGQSCAGSISVSSATVEPLEAVNITITFPVRWRDEIGVVIAEANSLESIYIKPTSTSGVYEGSWTVPSTWHFPKVVITAEATSKDGSKHCVASAGLKVLLLKIGVSEEKGKLKVRKDCFARFKATIDVAQPSTPPYIYKWDLSGKVLPPVQSNETSDTEASKFTLEGTHTITVTVEDAEGRVGVGTCKVKVEEFSITKISEPGSLDTGEVGSWTAEVKGGTPPYKYTFQWGNDAWQTEVSTTANSAIASYSFTEAETYTITITVEDDNEWVAEAYVTVIVEGEAFHPYTLCQIDFDNFLIDIEYTDWTGSKMKDKIGVQGTLVYTGNFSQSRFMGDLQKTYKDYNGLCFTGILDLRMDPSDPFKVKWFSADIRCKLNEQLVPGSDSYEFSQVISGGGFKLTKNDYYMAGSSTGMQICLNHYIDSLIEELILIGEPTSLMWYETISLKPYCTDLSYLRIWCETY